MIFQPGTGCIVRVFVLEYVYSALFPGIERKCFLLFYYFTILLLRFNFIQVVIIHIFMSKQRPEFIIYNKRGYDPETGAVAG